jgi:hypothetical protein
MENPPYDIAAAYRSIAHRGADMLLVLSSQFLPGTATSLSNVPWTNGYPLFHHREHDAQGVPTKNPVKRLMEHPFVSP